MKIAVHAPVFGRHPAVKLFADSCKRNKLGPIIVMVSNDADYDYCKSLGLIPTIAANKPFGDKLQIGLEKARNYKFDALLLMGSDDTLTGIAKYRKALKDHDFVACGDCHFTEIGTGRQGYWPGYNSHIRKGEPAGAGRCFRRDLLDKMDWDLWTGCGDRASDGHQWRRLHEYRHSKKIFFREDGVILTDHKDKDSMTPFDELLEASQPIR